MRVLHVSDLHAGKTLGRINRNEDLYYALEQIINICKEEKIDLLLIAGDIYDKSHPDHESQNLILDFLTKMHSVGIHTVLIAGNHDSYDFIKSYKNLKRIARIHAFDRPCKNASDCIIKFGDLTVACLPYPSERVLTHIDEHTQKSYTQKVAQYLNVLAKQVEGSRYTVLLAHLMVESAKVSGSERQSTVGEFYAVKPEHIPTVFDYVALGHIHRHQRINKTPVRVYYSGSPYQIDFSEKGTQKYVNLIVFEDEPAVKPIRLDLKRELHEVVISVKESFYTALESLKALKGLVKVILKTDIRDSTISIKKKHIEDILEDRLVKFEVEYEGENVSDKGHLSRELDLLEAYKAYYKNTYGVELPEELRKEFINVRWRAEHETHTS